MKEVVINKADALTKLQENREAHRAIFEEAVDGFRTRATQALEDQLKRITEGKIEIVQVYLPKPVDHTRDYDREIAMLEMSIGDQVTLTQQEFASFVMDDWTWKREFLTSNSAYSVTAASMSEE